MRSSLLISLMLTACASPLWAQQPTVHGSAYALEAPSAAAATATNSSPWSPAGVPLETHPPSAPAPAPEATETVGPLPTEIQLDQIFTQPCDPEDPVKYPTIIVTGFFQADGLWFQQDADNKAVVGDAQDVADFRRARLGVKGYVAENVSYMIEFDFAFPGRPNFTDLYIDVADTALGNVRVGEWRQPFSIDALMSVRDLPFLERALPFAMVPFRQTGAGFYNSAHDDRVTWALSGYRFPTDTYGDVAGDRGYGMSGRWTALAYEESATNDTIHLGGSYSYNQPANSSTRIRSGPEVGFNQLDFRDVSFPVPFFVDTGPIPTDTYQVIGAELAGTSGSLWLQSEFICSFVNQIDGPSVFFPGAYAEATYVLTGEYRPYVKVPGVYGRVVPAQDYGDCGGGAWEVCARWSYLDLIDANVDGGNLHDLTFGLNWYLNKFTKFQFNYIHAMLQRPALNDSDANVLAVRAQVDF